LPKLAALSGKAVCVILALHDLMEKLVGCNKRSALHHALSHTAQCPLVIAPYGYLLSIIRQSGVPRAEFER